MQTPPHFIPHRLESEEKRGSIHDLSFSPNGTLLATSYGDIWDVPSRQLLAKLPVSSNGSIAFHPHRDIIAMAQDDAVLIIDIMQHAVIARLHIDRRCAESIAFSNDGTIVGIAGFVESEDDRTGIVRLWEWKPERLVLDLQEPDALFYSVAISPDAHLVAASGCFGPLGNSTSALVLWDNAGTRKARIENEKFGSNAMTGCVRFSPNGTRLAFDDVGGSPCIVTLTGELVRTFGERAVPKEPEADIAAVQKPGGYNSLAFSPDGRHLFAGGGGHHFDWDEFNSGTEFIEERLRRGGDMSTFFTDIMSRPSQPQSLPKFFGLLTCWNISTGETVATFDVGSTPINCLAISADGRTLAAGSDPGLALLWNLPSLEPQPPK